MTDFDLLKALSQGCRLESAIGGVGIVIVVVLVLTGVFPA